MRLQSLIKEIKSYRRLSDKSNSKNRKLVFYSENKVYYLYYEGIINSILKNSDLEICYITSDENDPIFQKESKRFKVYYIKDLLAFTLPFLKCKVLVMTMPDLNQFHIKRSVNDVEHIYVFHAIMSTHMAYRKGAFDFYDTIFCVGPHHYDEIKRMEDLYGLKSKKLVKVGYHWLEKVYTRYKSYLEEDTTSENEKKTVLIAPSWYSGNILESCIEQLVKTLLINGYNVVVRPHPEFVKRRKDIVDEIYQKFKHEKDFTIELNHVADESFYKSSALITDWSGIAFEYAFGTERPVVFIDTPRKVNNPEYDKLGIEPLEVKVRTDIGEVVKLEDIGSICDEVDKLIKEYPAYKNRIIHYRQKYIYNWMDSSDIGAEYIINVCDRK